MSIDPYSTPAATGQASIPYSQSAITEGVVRQLAGTKPWVRLISVVMFIGVAVLLLVAVGIFSPGGTIFKEASEGISGAAAVTAIVIIDAVIAVISLYPAFKLWKFANRVGDLVQSGQSMDLEKALNEQRAFWKFFGMIVVLMLVVGMVVLVGGVIAASKG